MTARGIGLLLHLVSLPGALLATACMPPNGWTTTATDADTHVTKVEGEHAGETSAESTTEEPFRIDLEEDEFVGVRTATLHGNDMAPHDFDVAIQAIPGELERGARMLLTSVSRGGWEYLRCHSLAMIVDGEPWGFLETDHDGRVMEGTGAVLEFIRVNLSAEQLEALMRATEIRARLCNDEWTWPRPMLVKLRELWYMVHERTPGQQVAPAASEAEAEPAEEPEGAPAEESARAAQPVKPQGALGLPDSGPGEAVGRSGGGCPGGVTTSGHCCTTGRACGGSCISRSRRCRH